MSLGSEGQVLLESDLRQFALVGQLGAVVAHQHGEGAHDGDQSECRNGAEPEEHECGNRGDEGEGEEGEVHNDF